jgi:hemerythrin superfamily protein
MNTILSKVSPSATTMIRMDHTHVLATFHRYKVDTPPQNKKGLVNMICTALEIHAQLEEEIFYPAMRGIASDAAVVDKSIPEHNEMKRLIGELRGMEPDGAAYDEKVMELMRDVMHHVADEETRLLPDAERLLADRLGELGAQMTKRRLELTAPRAGEIAMDTMRATSTGTMMMAAGAVLAGAYIVSRAFSSRNA